MLIPVLDYIIPSYENLLINTSSCKVLDTNTQEITWMTAMQLLKADVLGLVVKSDWNCKFYRKYTKHGYFVKDKEYFSEGETLRFSYLINFDMQWYSYLDYIAKVDVLTKRAGQGVLNKSPNAKVYTFKGTIHAHDKYNLFFGIKNKDKSLHNLFVLDLLCFICKGTFDWMNYPEIFIRLDTQYIKITFVDNAKIPMLKGVALNHIKGDCYVSRFS